MQNLRGQMDQVSEFSDFDVNKEYAIFHDSP